MMWMILGYKRLWKKNILLKENWGYIELSQESNSHIGSIPATHGAMFVY